MLIEQRHKKNAELMRFLESHQYKVLKIMSADRKHIIALKVGYEEIPESTEKPKLAKN